MTTVLEYPKVDDYWAIAVALSKELAASAVERDRTAGIPYLEVQCLREAGLLPLLVPRAYGGIGASWVEGLRIVRELSKADGSTGQLYANQLILSMSSINLQKLTSIWALRRAHLRQLSNTPQLKLDPG